MSSKEISAETLSRLFLAPDAPLGETWLQSASLPLSDDSLPALVLASNIPSMVKARSTYGHFRTASQMHKVSGRYWKPEPELFASLQQETLRLNPHPLPAPMDRLQTLYSDTVGGILLVTKQFFKDGTATLPYITIVAAPSLAPRGKFSPADPPGIATADYWDATVLAPYSIQIGDGLHCPMLTASEGFSRATKLPGSDAFLTDAQPLFFPLGEQLAEQITTPSAILSRSFFLPEICDMPLGMAWPTNISFEDFYSSIQSLKGGYSIFLRVLQAIKPQLMAWFVAVNTTSALFICPSFPLLEIHSLGFPALSTGDYPNSILDTQAFSPLLEMLNGFIWRLTSDLVLATGSIEARQVFSTFLQRGETAITPASYFGAAIPGRLCPTFAYHFTVGERWPTRQNPLADLIQAPFLSDRAKDYEPLVIDLYMLTLITKDQLSTDAHKRRTPKRTYADLLQVGSASPVIPAPEQVTDSRPRLDRPVHPPADELAAYPNSQPPIYPHHQSDPTLPAITQLYSPQAPLEAPVPPQPRRHPNRSLGQAFANTIAPVAAVAKNFDPLTASILTAQGRADATGEFLNCCRLLIHHDPTLALIDSLTGIPLPTKANLFPREPTRHFRRDVLGPISGSQTGYVPNFFNYVEALMSSKGILVESSYTKSFFTSDRIQALLSIESWAMSPQTRDLAHLPSQTLHVYGFLQCLNEYPRHANLLPAKGISLLQAKHLGYMVPLLFRMMDMKPDFLTSRFDGSVLGQRLLQWSTLPDSPAIHHLWVENPRLLTFLWFSTLREALFIMHSWVKAQRYHRDQGFHTATDTALGTKRLLIADTFPSHIPGQTTTLMEAFTRYDLQFAARWYEAAYSPHDPTWRSQPPPDQFVFAPTSLPKALPVEPREPTRKQLQHNRQHERARDPAIKRPKLESVKDIQKAADFTSGAHLFEPVVPLPKDHPAITTILARLKRGTRFPKLPDSHGTFEYICFHSAFPAPHNRCVTAKCKNYYASPPTFRIHLDPSLEPWKSNPESFWQPIVAFLKQEDVSIHFKPSPTLVALTPSTTWT